MRIIRNSPKKLKTIHASAVISAKIECSRSILLPFGWARMRLYSYGWKKIATSPYKNGAHALIKSNDFYRDSNYCVYQLPKPFGLRASPYYFFSAKSTLVICFISFSFSVFFFLSFRFLRFSLHSKQRFSCKKCVHKKCQSLDPHFLWLTRKSAQIFCIHNNEYGAGWTGWKKTSFMYWCVRS